MNKNQSYRLFTITTTNGATLYAAYIRHYLHAGFMVFSDEATRAEYMQRELATMEALHAPLYHDSRMQPPASLIEAYQRELGLFSKVNNKQLYKAF